MMGKETDGNLAVVAAEMNECVGAVACMVALVMAGCMQGGRVQQSGGTAMSECR